jgi:hypothetical protein
MLIPFYPKKEFAEFFAKNEWLGCKAKSIDLACFIDKWLTRIENDRIKTINIYN